MPQSRYDPLHDFFTKASFLFTGPDDSFFSRASEAANAVTSTVAVPSGSLIFAEKENDRLVLRRGFQIGPGDKFIVAEDVVTRGGRVMETIAIVREHGAEVVAVASIVDRSGGQLPDFGCPYISLTRLNVETFAPDNLPPDLEGTPASKPGSK